MADKNLNGRGLRILLFGTPGSGKSSLLGALWQAAQSQESALGGKISNPTGGLAELRESLYSKEPRESSSDMAGYAVSLEPAKGETIEAVLIDTDGRITEEHLTSKGAVEGKSAGARAVRTADAVLFLVDPTKGATNFEKEFQQFCTFVESLETHRSKRIEVAGLPIYLVLTKCDQYGKSTDATATWVQKIEDAKRKVDKKFQDCEAKFPHPTELPFGKADVRVWATSVKRPALADRPAKSQEPYGVAELFRQCLQAAQDFHNLRLKSRGRLQLILLGFLLVIAVMLCAGGIFFITRPSEDVTKLESEIQAVLPGQKGNTAERLKEPLDKRLEKLIEITKDPAFKKLLPDQREEVKDACKEIEEYLKLTNFFHDEAQRDPKSAKDEPDLNRIKEALERVSIPAEYKDKWQETKVLKKHRQLLKDVDSIRAAVKAEDEWFTKQIDEGDKLNDQVTNLPTKDKKVKWLNDVKEFLERQPKKMSDPLPNSPHISYGTVYRFRKLEVDIKKLEDCKKALLPSQERVLKNLQKEKAASENP